MGFLGRYIGKLGAVMGAGLVTLFASNGEPQDIKSIEKEFKYAVVVSEETYDSNQWKSVADSLARRHGGSVVTYTDEEGIEGALPKLKALGRLTNVTYTARKGELQINNIPQDLAGELLNIQNSNASKFYEMLTRLDDDPFSDAFGSIVTGNRAADAQRMADAPDIVVRKVLGKGFENPITQVADGLVFGEARDYRPSGEGQQFVKTVRRRGGKEPITTGVERAGPEFTRELEEGNPDLIGFGGHAAHWLVQLGYGYDDWFLVSQKSKVYAAKLNEDRRLEVIRELSSTNNKAFVFPTNCFAMMVGPDGESLSLALQSACGGVQFVGHIDTAQSIAGIGNYVGHGFKFHAFETSETLSLIEALRMTHLDAEYAEQLLAEEEQRLGADGEGAERLDKKRKYGFIAYGDSACQVKLDRVPSFRAGITKERTITQIDDDTYRFDLRFRTDIQDSSIQRPGIYFLPFRIGDPSKVQVSPPNTKVKIGDDFVIVWGGLRLSFDPRKSPELDNRPIGVYIDHPPVEAGTEWTLSFEADKVE